MWLLPIQKNEAIIYKTYNINSLSYTLLPLMVSRERLVRYPALLAVSILENPNQNNIDCHSSDLCKSLPLHNIAIFKIASLRNVFVFPLYGVVYVTVHIAVDTTCSL